VLEPTVAVIIPVHNKREKLAKALQALKNSTLLPDEVIVVDDGSTDGPLELPFLPGLRVLSRSECRGPASARNAGARATSSDILFFIDSDVCVHAGTVERVSLSFADPTVDAVIGSYDREPAAPGFFSQYKNLLHHFTHQNGNRKASTFWSGCGAIRREVLLAFHGFDESYRRPAMEDIELGDRLTAGGRHVLLDPALQVQHLKAWTFWKSVRSDIFDRAIPWTELILRTRRMPDDLNLRASQRESVFLVWLAMGLGGIAASRHNEATTSLAFLAAAIPSIGAAVILNCSFYFFLQRARGLWFALKAVPVHLTYFLYSGLAFLLGLGTYALRSNRVWRFLFEARVKVGV
jgi:glycosyltransferase involved in cell wall biosynthesis